MNKDKEKEDDLHYFNQGKSGHEMGSLVKWLRAVLKQQQIDSQMDRQEKDQE
jgi:hypothetical protein